MTHLLLLLLACNGGDTDTDDTCPVDTGAANDTGEDSGSSGDSGDTDDCPPEVVPGLTLITDDLSQPLVAVAPPGDPRLFIAQRRGLVRILSQGTLLQTPFLDLDGLISTGNSEQGLLGLAFHPDYATNGKFYVNYTDPDGDTVVAEYTVSSDANVANTTGRVVLTQDQHQGNHNGGHLAFGPDGYLYIGLGDGGGAGDPEDEGQDPLTWLGTILRIDPVGAPYSVPANNPFVGNPAGADEVWAYGLRNPWRFAFDSATGDLYIADVGQNDREEINRQPASSTGGENYGWNAMEGSVCYVDGCDTSGKVLPVHEYRHSTGCSITGGYVYRGSALPALRGHYLFSDYCTSFLHSISGDNAQLTDWTDTIDPDRVLGRISSFGLDHEGEIYVLDYQNGALYKLAPR